MSSLCEVDHSPLLDSTTATIVCCKCGLVLDEQLTCEDVDSYGLPSHLHAANVKVVSEDVDGEPVKDLLNKIGDRLNLSESTIENSYARFTNTKKILKKNISCAPHMKNKRAILSNKNVLVYSMYITLKLDYCPRSIREICYYSGYVKPLDVLKIEKFLELNRKSTTPASRMKPITPKDIIMTYYPYIDGFTFDDVQQLNHRINIIQCNNFSPVTTAAGSVYLYVNQVKKTKTTLLQLSNLFKISSMSIQRFVKCINMYFDKK